MFLDNIAFQALLFIFDNILFEWFLFLESLNKSKNFKELSVHLWRQLLKNYFSFFYEIKPTIMMTYQKIAWKLASMRV